MKSFTPLILIILSVAAYFMYIQPTFTEVQALNDTKNQYANVLQKAKDLAAKLGVSYGGKLPATERQSTSDVVLILGTDWSI